MTLGAIRNIDMATGRMYLHLEMGLSWRDPRLLFRDLKPDHNLNLMRYDEQTRIWLPSVAFVDTEPKFSTVNDERSRISVRYGHTAQLS